jgi:hypothetical protein
MGVVAPGSVVLTMPVMSYMVLVFPGFILIQASLAEFIIFFNGPYTLLSRSWSLCECRGKESKTIPERLQK